MSTTTSTTSTGTSRFTNWEEAPAYGDGAPLPRIARADVDFAYEGDLDGTGECRYIFRYGPDGSCQILGFEHVTGTLAGRRGEFALRHEGTFGASGLSVASTVVPGSATGELEGLSGTGTFTAPAGEETCSWTLEHSGR
jgi:hypothetical protein